VSGSAIRWLLGGALVAVVGAVLVWAFVGGRREIAREREYEGAIRVPPRTARSPGGEVLVALDAEAQRRIALTTETLTVRTLEPEIVAYGSLEEDPSRSFTLRAPAAGFLHPASKRAWPSLGETLADRTVVGILEPRVAAVDRVDLGARLAAARADVDAVTASLAAARAALDRARALNAEDKIVSDRALQEAEVRVRGEEARLRASTETVRLIESSLRGTGGPTGPRPLEIERGGEVVDLSAQPGEAVEAGQPILRVARFDRLVAKVHLPAGQRIDGPVTAARIVLLGHEEQALRGERIALAATADPATRGLAFLFRVAPAGFPLRPGSAVTAYLPAGGPSRSGVVIRRAALVRASGRAWVYVQVDEGRFTRREVPLDTPAGDGWFVVSGFRPGDRVVVAGAQTLLSEEFKPQIPISDEGDAAK
jgi:hypothetical protein